MLANEVHLQYTFRHGQPCDVDNGNGTRYFVDLSHARLMSRPDDSGSFTLPLRSEDGRTYVLKWRIDGEFDSYIGSTPHIPLTRAPGPFHLKEMQQK